MPSPGTGAEDVAADAADGDEASHPTGLGRWRLLRDHAAHRVADDVDAVEPEGVEERSDGRLAGEHRVLVGRVADAEPGSSSTRQRNDRANVARLPPKLRQPVTPGPEPWSISRGGPWPTS